MTRKRPPDNGNPPTTDDALNRPPDNGKPPKTEIGALWFQKNKSNNQQQTKELDEPT